jgi:S-adenosylmethionine:tRNA ribosyltransferase-isomerase
MIAATAPSRHPGRAKLLAVRPDGHIEHWPRSALPDLLRPGDLVVANDAATLPASLAGTHLPTGCAIEVRLAGRRSLDSTRVSEFVALVFGAGDFRIRTEDRPKPPALASGVRLALGPLEATVVRVLDHPRLILLRFDGSLTRIWEGLARHGRPIQYSHVAEPLALWDVWTALAGPPVAFEAPSAGFALSWSMLRSLARRSIRVATLTHAAGLSSTGDPALDARLPFDEPYRIPAATSQAIRDARARCGRVVAIGTTVVRALEHAASLDCAVAAGEGLANQTIGGGTRLRVVDALLSGAHESGTSHHQLLRAFVDDLTLACMDQELERHGYRTHEFGDSILVERNMVTSRSTARSTCHHLLPSSQPPPSGLGPRFCLGRPTFAGASLRSAPMFLEC